MLMTRLLHRFLLFVALTLAAGTAAHAETYTVEDVPAQASAGSPLAARDAALTKAQRDALDILLKRLVTPGTEASLPPVTDDLVFKTMLGFEVRQEKTSATTYTALISVEFRKDAVDELLAGAGVGFVEQAARPLAVVPLLVNTDGSLVLFDGDSPWRDAWGRRDGQTDPQRLVVPVGDLQDLQALTPQMAQAGDPGGLALIAQHYDAGGALLVTAMVTAAGLSVSAADPGQAPFYDGHFAPGAYDEAVAATAAAIQARFRSLNEVPAGPPATLDARAFFEGLRGWRDLKQTLEGVPGVRRVMVRRLIVGEAAITIDYQGDPSTLRAALAQRGVGLNLGPDGGWEVRTGAVGVPLTADPGSFGQGFGGQGMGGLPPAGLFPPTVPEPEPTTPVAPDLLFQ